MTCWITTNHTGEQGRGVRLSHEEAQLVLKTDLILCSRKEYGCAFGCEGVWGKSVSFTCYTPTRGRGKPTDCDEPIVVRESPQAQVSPKR